jgi:LysM repeat protein
LVSAETPVPSPTRSQYSVRSGDTLSQIAERFRITVELLLAANPGVNPNALRVGESLLIPASPADRVGEATPTPVGLPVREIACHPTANGAVWCFVLIHNDTPDLIENVTAQISLVDPGGASIDSKPALMPLDILPPGASLPLSVLFPPPVPLEMQPRVQFLTAIRLLPGDQRYLPALVQNTLVEVSWAGYIADIRGEVLLPGSSPGAATIWVAAVAYDRLGNVVGWRRWESTGGLAPGASMPFEFTVSSVAAEIHHVEFAVQARP